ncbi:MAG TPA: hypothetical protein VGV91_13660 [Rubrobacter sp.]|nr:hypothetical protein [Rubrobacter sp.]
MIGGEIPARPGEDGIGDDARHLLEIPVVVEQERVVLDGDAGDEAVRGGADGG